MFNLIIKDILDQNNYLKYDSKNFKLINLIIFVIINRLLLITVRLTNHCNKKTIDDLYIDLAMKIELPQLEYNLDDINNIKSINNLIRNIYYQNIASVLDINKSTIIKISKLAIFIIKYLIQKGNKDNQLDNNLILSDLKTLNKDLYLYLINKYSSTSLHI